RADSGVRRRRSWASPGGSRRRPGAREQIDELTLEPVRVLELVDQDRPEAPALALADRGVVAEEVAGRELEILEVESRLVLLGRGIGVGKASQQLLEQGAVAGGGLVEGRLLHRAAGLLVAGEPLPGAAARRDVGEIEQPLGRRRTLEKLECAGGAGPCRLGLVHSSCVLDDAAGCLTKLGDPRIEARARRNLEHEIASGRAKRFVDAREHSAQTPRAVGREQADPLLVALRAELLQRGGEGLAREHARLVLVENAEARIDGRFERVRLQQRVAETVAGRDPRTGELSREVVP